MQQSWAYIGIDPGVNGGFCLLAPGKFIVEEMPKKSKKDILQLIKELREKAWNLTGLYPKVAMEEIPPVTYGATNESEEGMHSVPSVAKIYGAYCTLEAFLIACHLPFTPVKSKKWQKEVGAYRKKGDNR